MKGPMYVENDQPNAVTMILGDGGIKAGFIAGAADEVLRHCSNVSNNLTCMVGTSASAGNIIYYLAHGNNHPGREMWTTLLTDKRFLNFTNIWDLFGNTPLYDINFMVDEIFMKENPIDSDKVKLSSILFYLPVQRLRDSKIVYFTNDEYACSGKYDSINREFHSIEDVDLYQLMKAASAAPLISDQVFEIDGESYLDAAALEPLSVGLPPIKKELKIIILTKGRAGFFKKARYILVAMLFMLIVWPFKKTRLPLVKYWQYGTKPFRLNREIALAEAEERAGRAVILYPTSKIGGLLDNSPDTLVRTYEHGVECAQKKFGEIEKMMNAF